MKDNAIFEVVEIISENTLLEGNAGVIKEEKVNLCYKEHQKDKEVNKLMLRRITYQDEKGRLYVFISNNTAITVQNIADIYKQCWQIELLFKKMKQNFQLHCFYGETENAILNFSRLINNHFNKNKSLFFFGRELASLRFVLYCTYYTILAFLFTFHVVNLRHKTYCYNKHL